jgi:hypothetical protein
MITGILKNQDPKDRIKIHQIWMHDTREMLQDSFEGIKLIKWTVS